jgi:hypothetical protein
MSDELLSCRIKKRYVGFFGKLLTTIVPPIIGLFLVAVAIAYAWFAAHSIMWAWNPASFALDNFNGGVFMFCAVVCIVDLMAGFISLLIIDSDDSPLIVYAATLIAIVACVSGIGKILAGLTYAGWIAGSIIAVIALCIWGYLVIFYVCEAQKQLAFIARKRIAASQKVNAE